MGGILDRGSLLFASLAAVAVSALLPVSGVRFYTPLLVLAVFYVPGVLVLGQLVSRLGGDLAPVFQRDYAPLLTCTAMAYAAVCLPLVAAGWLRLAAQVLIALAALALGYFLVLMFFAIRTVFGAGNGAALAVLCLSWIPLVAGAFLWGPLRFLLGWIASPFFLFFAYYYLGCELGNLGAGFRRRQHFRRTLEAAAINPHDGEAQYQLGLIYQQRRQLSEASDRFSQAVAIDPQHADAHYQLGRIAREQGRLADALAHFQPVYDQDDRHSQSEILRELGAVYLAARQYDDARNFLEQYTERRSFDPEGLCYLGQALEGLGRAVEARDAYMRAIEATRTAPRYMRPAVARWSRLAQRQLKKLPPRSAAP